MVVVQSVAGGATTIPFWVFEVSTCKVWKPKAAAASRLAEESSRKKHSSAFALI